MPWSFAIVNNKLAEIYFNERKKARPPKIWGHCYVKRSEYKTRKEQKWIKEDTAQYKFIWRNRKYKKVPPDWIKFSSLSNFLSRRRIRPAGRRIS